MRQLILIVGLLLGPNLLMAMPISYLGDLGNGDAVTGTVPSDGWTNGPMAVDFWQFSGNAGDELSLSASNLSDNDPLLIAVYSGVTDDFGDFFGTPAFFETPFDWGGMTGLFQFQLFGGLSTLLDFALPLAGDFTLIVGGSGFAPTGGTDVGYQLQLVSAQVPAPAMLPLLAIGLLGLGLASRRRNSM